MNHGFNGANRKQFTALFCSGFKVIAFVVIRFDDIGNRLKAFRLGSGLSADEIATRLGISRTALYRFEKGELAKIRASIVSASSQCAQTWIGTS